MPVTATHLTTSGSETDATSYTTASVTPTANNLELLSVFSMAYPDPTGAPTVSGASLTWVQVATLTHPSDTKQRITLFRAMSASPSSGALTIDFGTGATQDRCEWSLSEFGSVDTTGTNGSGAVVQSVTNSGTGTTLTVTLAAFSNSNNATYGGFGEAASTTNTAGSGFSILGQGGAGIGHIATEWRNDNDTTVDTTWADSALVLGVAIEIRSSSSTTTSTSSSSSTTTSTSTSTSTTSTSSSTSTTSTSTSTTTTSTSTTTTSTSTTSTSTSTTSTSTSTSTTTSTSSSTTTTLPFTFSIERI